MKTRQQGATLVIGLIMLIMIMLATISGYNMTQISLDIVGNLQNSGAVQRAADATLEEALSTRRMFETPNTIILDPCAGNNTRCYDINGDGTDDITVALDPPPFCIQVQIVQNAALNPADPLDRGCAVGIQQTFGIQGAATGASLCSDTVWEMTAAASDDITGASATVRFGAGVRVSANSVASACN